MIEKRWLSARAVNADAGHLRQTLGNVVVRVTVEFRQRIADQRHRCHHPLQLSAGYLVRVALADVFRVR